MSETGRPSKAKRNPNQLGFDQSFEILLGRADDSELVWNEPAELIRKELQSIGGIARLAKVDPRTVLRRGIAPGCAAAIEFVRDRRIKIGRPLVVTQGVPLDHRNASPKFLGVINSIHALRKHFEDENAKTYAVWDAQLNTRPRMSGFGKNVIAYDENRMMTDAERPAYAKKRRFQYEPQGRVTIAQLCQFRDMSRQAFWKWRRGLPSIQREELARALAGEVDSDGKSGSEHKVTEPSHRPVAKLAPPGNKDSSGSSDGEYERLPNPVRSLEEEYERLFDACDGRNEQP